MLVGGNMSQIESEPNSRYLFADYFSLMAYIQISLSTTYNTTGQPFDPNEATRAVQYSRNYKYCYS